MTVLATDIVGVVAGTGDVALFQRAHRQNKAVRSTMNRDLLEFERGSFAAKCHRRGAGLARCADHAARVASRLAAAHKNGMGRVFGLAQRLSAIPKEGQREKCRAKKSEYFQHCSSLGCWSMCHNPRERANVRQRESQRAVVPAARRSFVVPPQFFAAPKNSLPSGYLPKLARRWCVSPFFFRWVSRPSSTALRSSLFIMEGETCKLL